MIQSFHTTLFLAQFNGGGGGTTADFFGIINRVLGPIYGIFVLMAIGVIAHGARNGFRSGEWKDGMLQGFLILSAVLVVSIIVPMVVPGAPGIHVQF